MTLRPLGLLLVAVFACCALFVSDAAAQSKGQTVTSLIKKSQAMFDEQRYEESIQTLSAALLRPTIAKEEKIEVYKLLAYNYIVLNRTEEADGAVRGLLVLDPEFSLPETESPRFRDFFEQVRKDWEKEGRPGLVGGTAAPEPSKAKIVHRAPASVDEGSSIELTGSVEDPTGDVAELTVSYRQGSKGKFESTTVSLQGRKFRAQIPSQFVAPPLVEYYLEARNKDGLPVASRGDAETPLRVVVSSESSVVASPALWVPVGLAVAAAVTIPVALFASGTLEGDSEVTVSVFESAPAGFSFRF